MSEIKHIRLINGDEIFGSIVLEEDNQITVGLPLVATDVLTPDGREATSLVPYLPFVDTDKNHCVLKNNMIITCTDVHDAVEDHYNLSLHYVEKSTDRRIQEIEEINQYMRESIVLNEIEEDEDLISVALH